jgi:hypothetical protein
LSTALRAYEALVFRKQKHFDMAEQIYNELLQNWKSKPNELSEDDKYKLQLGRAAVFAEKGDFKKYADTFPSENRRILKKDGTMDYAPDNESHCYCELQSNR